MRIEMFAIKNLETGLFISCKPPSVSSIARIIRDGIKEPRNSLRNKKHATFYKHKKVAENVCANVTRHLKRWYNIDATFVAVSIFDL